MKRLKLYCSILATILVPTLLLLALAVVMFDAGYQQGQQAARPHGTSQTFIKEGE